MWRNQIKDFQRYNFHTFDSNTNITEVIILYSRDTKYFYSNKYISQCDNEMHTLPRVLLSYWFKAESINIR